MYKAVIHIIKVASITLLLVCHVLAVRGQQPFHMTIGNNLLYDATLTPNLRIGIRLAEHWSAGLTAGYRPWPTDDETNTKWRHLLLSPDVRYWFKGVNTGHFIGGNLIYAHYNIANVDPIIYNAAKDIRRQGDLGAVGAFYGYSWPLGRYWNIEAQIGAAVAYTKYSAYACGHCGRKLKDDSKVLLLPQAALSVVYNIPGRPRKTVEEPQIIIEEPIAEPQIELPVRPAPEPVFEEPVVVEQKSEPVIAKTKVRDTLYVHFPWSKSVLSEDFRENRETLQRIIDATRESASNGHMTIKKIQIVGLASVEGNTAYNERLAHNRALALKKYVQQRVNLPDEKFEIVGGGEAWEWFRKQLVENVDKRPDLKRAIEIIDTAPNVNNRKWRLHVMNHGQTWEYIRRNILKNQRNSGYIIVYYEDDEKQ